MIEPFFFGDDQLFGSYHPPADFSANRVIVICPPFFDEYRRSYCALSNLANACAQQGAHVVRFDYFGTGESFGLLAEATAERWESDVGLAVDESLALTGASEAVVIGIRFGATLAARCPNRLIKRFVLWDPFLDGSSFLQWLDRVNDHFGRENEQSAGYVNSSFDRKTFINFRLSEMLSQDLSRITLDLEDCRARAEVALVTSQKRVAESEVYEQVDYPGVEHDWPAYHDGLLTVKPVLEAMARRALQP